jgi:hypothetical protein
LSNIEDGGPAFPHARVEWRGDSTSATHYGGGMSLRDWFAGQALAGLIALSKETNEVLAETCFAVAGAMIAARAPALTAASETEK